MQEFEHNSQSLENNSDLTFVKGHFRSNRAIKKLTPALKQLLQFNGGEDLSRNPSNLMAQKLIFFHKIRETNNSILNLQICINLSNGKHDWNTRLDN